jgi:hypothetical protein
MLATSNLLADNSRAGEFNEAQPDTATDTAVRPIIGYINLLIIISHAAINK